MNTRGSKFIFFLDLLTIQNTRQSVFKLLFMLGVLLLFETEDKKNLFLLLEVRWYVYVGIHLEKCW